MNFDAGQYSITRQLPKTGQTTSYRAGDDGEYEAGWWLKRLNANNKIRFNALTLSGENLILDRATGLMWPENFAGNGANLGNPLDWFLATVWAEALNFAGFTDWRLPNIAELFSLVDFGNAATQIWSSFLNVSGWSRYWSSTTRISLTTAAHAVRFNATSVQAITKTDNTLKVVAVRKGV